MRTSSIVLVRWRTIWFIASVLALASLAGCFKSPEVSKIICTGDTTCPAAYRCVLTNGSTHGACVKTQAPLDAGGLDTTSAPAPANVATPLDATIDRSNGSLDQGAIGALDTSAETAVLPDTGLGKEVQPDSIPPDAPMDTLIPVFETADAFIPDLPMQTLDTAPGPDTATSCTGGCCSNSDCLGTCQTCSANHTCVAVLNADDPSGRCAGTCDATGTCKSKKGQSCQTVAAGCASGTTCSPDGLCCDQACTNSCMACDISGFLGTCTPVASGDPHGNRAACTGTDATCSGTCVGRNDGQCSYPANKTCGTASCTGTTYQAAGTCNAGSCAIPAAQACPTLQTCSNSACTCLSPYLSCSTNCINPQTEAANCGSCGHDCLGGTCSGGKCQPAVVVPSLGLYSFVFGVDSQYVYYSDCSDIYTCYSYRVSKSAVNATGASLTSEICAGQYVLGNTMYMFRNQQPGFLCTIGSTCAPNNPSNWFANGYLAVFKTPSPSYFADVEVGGTAANTTLSITWYSATKVSQGNASWVLQPISLQGFHAVGNSVYWLDTTDDTLNGTNGFPPATVQYLQLAGSVGTVGIADANAQSILLSNYNTNYLSRVPLPGGLGSAAPQQIAGATGTKNATEDANGIYWFDTTGILNRCSAPTCSNSTIMVSGQAPGVTSLTPDLGKLYQDASALYWVNGQGQVVRLAK